MPQPMNARLRHFACRDRSLGMYPHAAKARRCLKQKQHQELQERKPSMFRGNY